MRIGIGLALTRPGGVSDTTAPTVTGQAIQSNGTSLVLTFSAAVTGFASGADGLALTGLSGGATTLTYASGNGTTSVTMTVSRTVMQSETGGKLAYTAGDITKVSNGVALADFSNVDVTNSSTQVAPSIRNITTGTTGAGTTTVTLPTRSSGDALVVVVAGSTLPTANTGWTRQVNQTDAGLTNAIGVYTRQSDGTDSTPFGSTVMTATPYTAISVQNPATGHDVSGGNSSTASTSMVAPTVTVTASNDVLICGYMRSSGTGTITVPGSQTATTAVSSATLTLRCGYETLSASGATGTRTATQSSSVNWAAASVAVK